MNSSRRMYHVGETSGAIREDLKLNAKTFRCAHASRQRSIAHAIYAQNFREFNGGLGKTTLGILPPGFQRSAAAIAAGKI